MNETDTLREFWNKSTLEEALVAQRVPIIPDLRAAPALSVPFLRWAGAVVPAGKAELPEQAHPLRLGVIAVVVAAVALAGLHNCPAWL